MGRHRSWFRLATIGWLLSPAAATAQQQLHLLPGVEEIATDTIPDLAIAVVDLPQPVIYFNPQLARRYGPEVARFLLAHEYGHIAHRHSRRPLADLAPPVRNQLLQRMELDADCYAASQTGKAARRATEAAIRFFTRLGPFRFDNQHPTGAQRVSRILACLPGPRSDLALGRGDTGLESGPVSGEPVLARFRLETPNISESGYAKDAVVWVDGHEVGRLSNMRFPREIAVSQFGAGIHSYRVTLALYGMDELMQLVPYGSVAGQGHFTFKDGDAFRISWAPGSPPSLVKLAE